MEYFNTLFVPIIKPIRNHKPLFRKRSPMARRTIYDQAADKALKDLKDSQEKRKKSEDLVKRLTCKEKNLLKTLTSLEQLIGRELISHKKSKPCSPKNATESIDRILERCGAMNSREIANEATRLNVFPEADDSSIYRETRSVLREQFDEGNYQMFRKNGIIYYSLLSQ